MLLRVMLLLAVGLAGSAQAVADPAVPQIRLKVFKVFDGDRLLLRGRGESHRVSLDGIDAPELQQPWGERSRQLLEKMIAGQRVEVRFVDADKTRVRIKFLKYDISQEMLAAGAAWALPDAEPALKAVETEAREAGKGLWAPGELTPIAPWVWREGR